MKIYEQKRGKLAEKDRHELAAILVKAGYAVKIGAAKAATGNKLIYYVEILEDEKAEVK